MPTLVSMPLSLEGTVIVHGVTGGIAAYKAAELTSLLRRSGAEVHVIMTKAAMEFVSPLTFRTLSGNPVASELFDEPQIWEVPHVSLADRAHLLLVAPATANFLGKAASGIADDLLSTTLLAYRGPVLLAPAMNDKMYTNPVVQENISRLKNLGFHFVGPAYGVLACEREGPGRMEEPGVILREVLHLTSRKDLAGRRILITASCTREFADPVRFISNPSTGKMGFSLAEEATRRGADVTMVTGPSHLPDPPHCKVIRVISASEMHRAVMDNLEGIEVFIASAAVSDYRPREQAPEKIKKGTEPVVMELILNPDILEEARRASPEIVLVGFAAETGDLLARAREKLARKGLSFIVANSISIEGAGFAADTNQAIVLTSSGEIEELPLMKKTEMASRLLDRVAKILEERENSRKYTKNQ